MDSPPLLSKNALIELAMIKINPNGTLKDTCTDELRIKSVKPPNDIDVLLSEYNDKFQGIGCFWDKSTGKEIEDKLEKDPEAIPVARKPCPVPNHLQKPLKEWPEQGVKENIFEKVPGGETITWCSSLVEQHKPKYADIKNAELESQMIRASTDMRVPNEATKRSRCVQSLRVEDFYLPLAWLQDLHEIGLKTRLSPTDTRPCHKTGSNIQHTVGKLQTKETRYLELNLHKMF